MNAIDIVHVSKTYKGKRGGKVEALHDLDLSIAQGEVFGFLGPNGAGKSTTIKILMGQMAATSGAVTLFGISAAESSARMRVGYLPENPAFYDFLTGREYLTFVGKAFNMPEQLLVDERKRVLDLLELTDAADRPIRGYSKGMVQRLGLAQALLHDPDLYIFDEPMSGLDPLGRALVKSIIKGLKERGKTVFFSTHITADVEIVCDRVGILVKGLLMAVDNVSSILDRGVEGHIIQFRDRESVVREVYVEKDRLADHLELLRSEHASVERIEPKRKDLETFFLDVVAQR